MFSFDKQNLHNRSLIFVLDDNEIKLFIHGTQIAEFINAAMSGYYGTIDGLFLFKNEDPHGMTHYDTHIIDGITEVVTFSSENIDHDELSMLSDIHEIVMYEPFNPVDIRCGKTLCYTLSTRHGNTKIDKLRYSDAPPIYKAGDTKEKILAMYDGLKSLEEYIDDERVALSEKYKSAYEIMFDEDARCRHFNNIKNNTK